MNRRQPISTLCPDTKKGLGSRIFIHVRIYTYGDVQVYVRTAEGNNIIN